MEKNFEKRFLELEKELENEINALTDEPKKADLKTKLEALKIGVMFGINLYTTNNDTMKEIIKYGRERYKMTLTISDRD